MDNTFLTEILTPERIFFSGQVKSISVEALDGRLTVLANHIPMVCSLSVGQLIIETEDGTKTAFHSKGYLDVTRAYTVMLCQTCEWPDEIDEQRAEQAAKRAQERILQENRAEEMGHSKLALLRAISRLRVKEHNSDYRK